MPKIHRKWSSYLGLLVWGAAAFMSQPTLASMAVHFTVLPLLIGLTIFLAHREGRRS